MLRRENYITNIFIDLDGPILDVSERYYEAYRYIVKQLRGKPISRESYWRLKRNKTSLEKVLKLSNIFGKEKEFRRDWLDLIEKKPFLLYDKIWPAVKTILKEIKTKHKIILVTLRRSSLNLSWQLQRLGINKYFNSILCKDDNKDDWSVKYNLIRDSGELDKKSCIIGDTEIDILAGKKLGIKTIAVLSGLRGRFFLKQYKPDYIINSLPEILDIMGHNPLPSGERER